MPGAPIWPQVTDWAEADPLPSAQDAATATASSARGRGCGIRRMSKSPVFAGLF
jgi:hypothetical protein